MRSAFAEGIVVEALPSMEEKEAAVKIVNEAARAPSDPGDFTSAFPVNSDVEYLARR